MLYIINNKPYVKVSNYYKEVKVEKKGKEYSVKPIGGEETRIHPKPEQVTSMSVAQYLETKSKESKILDVE